MPAFLPITLKDASATPADVVFNPRTKLNDGAKGVWVNGGGVPMKDEVLTAMLTKTASNRYRIPMTLKVPTVLETTVGGVVETRLLRTALVTVSYQFEAGHTQAERDYVMALVHSLTSPEQAITAGLVRNLDGVY